MDKPLRRYISLFLGTIGVVFGILLLPLTLYEYVAAVFGFLNGAMLVAGIGIIENWWRTRPKSRNPTPMPGAISEQSVVRSAQDV